MEQRIFLNAVNTLSAIPTSITGIESSTAAKQVVDTGYYTSITGVTGNAATTNATAATVYEEYQVYEFDTPNNPIFATPATLTSLTNLNLQIYDTGEAASGTKYAASPGTFNVYLLPTYTSDSSLVFNSDPTGLVGQAGVTSSDLLGTINFSSPPTSGGYLTFSLNSPGLSNVASTIISDINNGTAFQIAVTPATTTTAADGVIGNYNGVENPILTLTGTVAAANRFAFSTSNYTVNENDSSNLVTVSVLRSGSNDDAATVNYATSNGTALAGSNYTATSGTIDFAAGQDVATFTVALPTTPPSMSSSQNFTVTLSSPADTNHESDSLGSQSTATVTIVPTPVAANLTGTAGTVTDIEPSGTFGTTYAVVNGDSSAGTGSYEYLAYEVLEFSQAADPSLYPAAGYTVNSLSNLSLQLDNHDASTDGTNYAAHLGNIDVYFIPNTDAQTATSSLAFQFADPTGLNGQAGVTNPPDLLGTFSVGGAGGFDTFTPASLNSTVANAIVADLNSGANFRLVVIPQTYGVGAVAVRYEGLFESDTPTLLLNASVSQVAQSETLSFTDPTYTVNENAGTATILLTRAGYLSDTASVEYATSDGTALAGTNYTATSGTANFLAGSATTSFTVPITDVINQGGNKILNLTLSDPNSGNEAGSGNSPLTIATLGAQDTATLTINDANNTATNVTTLTQFASDISDVEDGPYTNEQFKINGLDGDDFPSYSVADFNDPTVTGPNGPDTFNVPTGETVEAINSLTLDVVTQGTDSVGGTFDVYLVSDTTSNIDPASPQSANPHYFDKDNPPEGIDPTGFGTMSLLGTVAWSSTEPTDASVSIGLNNFNAATEATLVSDLNHGTLFRIVATPEDDNVLAAFDGEVTNATTGAYEAPELSFNVTAVTNTSTTLVDNGPNSSTTAQSVSFTATVHGGVPTGDKVLLEDASNGDAVVGEGTTGSGGVANISVAAGVLSAGSHEIFAVYQGYETTGGDENFETTSSSEVEQNVTASAPTVTSVVVNGNIADLVGPQRSMVDSIVYTFSSAVNITGASAFTLAVHSGQTGTVPTLVLTALNNPNGDGSATEWAVTFTGNGVQGGSIGNGLYDITLNASDVTLDGSPSVTATPRATDTFYRLFGDLIGNQTRVNATDYGDFLSTYNLRSGQTGYIAAFDITGTGARINATDYGDFLADYNTRYTGFTPTI